MIVLESFKRVYFHVKHHAMYTSNYSAWKHVQLQKIVVGSEHFHFCLFEYARLAACAVTQRLNATEEIE
jgi:hypothetical protein